MSRSMSSSNESLNAQDASGAQRIAVGVITEQMLARGVYTFECTGPVEPLRDEYNRLSSEIAAAESGWLRAFRRRRAMALRAERARIPTEVKWRDKLNNVVTTVGKNKILDEALAGSAYTAAWYMGLISAVSYTTGPAAPDTMASHGGWTEAGPTNTPNYSQSTRIAAAFAAASGGSKALSAALTFSINSGSGVVVKGAFMNSVSTKDGTTGVLLSAGTFSGGDKTVSSGDSLAVSYSMSV